MSQPVILVNNLGKRYRIGERERYSALRDVLARPFSSLSRRKEGQKRADLWALKDLSFEVREGEVLGLIGRNGAGKSTLLKILSRITKPTEGSAEIRGRVGSLLEVGTGFHPELTGRENVFLNGAILGMSKREIQRKFDEIVAFAEVERFLDTPLKYYSSGMQVRLAFAVAAHLEPEILFIDEVLSVGDLSFQKKCLGKMGDVASQGRTIVFVSHQMNQIRRLCKDVIWLDGGTIRERGSTTQVVGNYESDARNPDVTNYARSSSALAQFLGWELVGARGDQANVLDWDGQVKVKFIARVHGQLRNIHHGIALYNDAREVVWGNAFEELSFEPGVHELTCILPSLPLRPGVYTWRVSLYHDGQRLDDWDCIPPMFVSTEPLTHKQDEFAGLLNIPSEFKCERVTDGACV
ncbi:MAG: ABC transporter ATP-binding protein [Candidatus Acidiferrales bacterium]